MSLYYLDPAISKHNLNLAEEDRKRMEFRHTHTHTKEVTTLMLELLNVLA